MTENNTKKAQEKIQEILAKCSTGSYIFRGENRSYEKVATGLYRQYCQSEDDNSTNDSNHLINNEDFSVFTVEKDIVGKVRRHIRTDAPDIEVLTELQHYGGKTALLDFTKDIHIALFFACDGNFDQEGRVIFFNTSGLTEKPDINYENMGGDEGEHIYTLISPTGKSPRVVFQSSIFVHVSRGYLEDNKYEIIEIENNLKEPLLEYLSKYFNIKTETIYNDIQGFIRNQRNHSNAEIEFYRGLTKQQEGKFEEAIVHYSKAIEFNPQIFEAYNNRGNAHSHLKQYEEAIQDYNKAIEITPQYAEAYNNRGSARFYLGQHEKVIETNFQYADVYNNRGSTNATLNKYREAIQDYNKAIEINSQYADAYKSRGNTHLHLGQHEEAIQDCEKAKFLFEKKGDMTKAEKCEKQITLTKKLMALT